jgi:ADP-ribosylglycohydrolase
LRVGDGFGGCFFWKTDVLAQIQSRQLPPELWRWSDDTAMGQCVLKCLELHQQIEPDALARLFADEYCRDPVRGYGTMAHTVLDDLGQGVPWQQAAGQIYDGAGSCGNGAAMRAGPLGAYFADDVERVVEEARRSAMVTHAHREGQAGAVAVAVAAAWAATVGEQGVDASSPAPDGRPMLEQVWTHTPDGATRSNLERALNLPLERSPTEAAALLGSGQKITAEDTVPFALWCAARHLHSYSEALWTTLAGEGDMDTTCAIVGSVVALCASQGIPTEWLARTEL